MHVFPCLWHEAQLLQFELLSLKQLLPVFCSQLPIQAIVCCSHLLGYFLLLSEVVLEPVYLRLQLLTQRHCFDLGGRAAASKANAVSISL